MRCPTCHHHHEDTPNHHPAYLQARIRELEQERDRALDKSKTLEQIHMGSYWYWQGDAEDHLETLTCPIIISVEKMRTLQAQLAAMTEDRDLWKEAHDDDCPNKNLLESTEAQLQTVQNSLAHEEMERDIARSQLAAVTKERDAALTEARNMKALTVKGCAQLQTQLQATREALDRKTGHAGDLSMALKDKQYILDECEAYLQAVTQERDTLLITNREIDAFANSKFGDVVAQLQAHNKELRDALEKVVNERYSELDMQTCGYSRGTSESEAWHQGVFSMCRQLKLIKAPAIAALTHTAGCKHQNFTQGRCDDCGAITHTAEEPKP